jgi:hypothetical protein
MDPELYELRKRIQRLERALPYIYVYDVSQTGESESPDARVVLTKTRAMRWNHWASTAKEVQSTICARMLSVPFNSLKFVMQLAPITPPMVLSVAMETLGDSKVLTQRLP